MRTEIKSSPWIVAILFLTLHVVMIDRMMANFLGPFLVKGLSLDPSQIGLAAGATGACWAVSALVFGAVSDRIGRRRVLIPAAFLFSTFSWLSGTATNFTEFLLCRALLGLTEGPCFAVLMALVEESSPEDRRARNMGVVNSAGPLAAGITPVLATWLALGLGWRWGFFGAAIPGYAMGVLIVLFVQEPKRASALAASTPRRRPGPSNLLANRDLWLCLLGAFGFVVSLMAFIVFAPLYMTQAMHQDPTTTGYLMSAAGFGGAAWSFFGTGLADRLGRRRALMLFSAMNAASISLFLVPGLYGLPLLLGALAFVLSAGPAAAALVFAVIPSEVVPRHHVAAAIGFAGIGAEMFGGSLGPAVGGMLAQSSGLAAPVILAVAGGAVVFVVALLLRETLPRGDADPSRAASEGVAA